MCSLVKMQKNKSKKHLATLECCEMCTRMLRITLRLSEMKPHLSNLVPNYKLDQMEPPDAGGMPRFSDIAYSAAALC